MRRLLCVASLLIASAIAWPLRAQQPVLTVTRGDGPATSLTEHANASPLLFHVTNGGIHAERIRLACQSAGQVVACSVFPRGLELAAGQTAEVTVMVGVGAHGSGQVELIAENGRGASASSEADVDIRAPAIVDATPDGDIVTPLEASGRSVAFTVANAGTGPVALMLVCDGQGVARCDGLDLSELVLERGAVRLIQARYSLIGTGIGTIVLTARSHSTETPIDIGGININACNGRCR